MKFDFKGIRFNTWLYFLGFAVATLTLLGILLTAFIKPYYRNYRIETVDNISSTIETSLIKENVTKKDIENTAKMVVGNNVCVLVFNENGLQVYSSDSLGQTCMLDKEISYRGDNFVIAKEPEKIISLLKNFNTIKDTVVSDITHLEMLLYGKMVKSSLANYYLVINTPLEPVESYVDFILSQYSYIAVIVVVIALIISYFLANRITSPIVKMKDEANKLAEGHYDVDFSSRSFSEINDLASTLDDATNKLSKIDELRRDLLANVSHDIKTPLTMIKAYAEMIKDISGDNKEKREEHLDVIIKEVDYLSKLVSDMQELSKLQSGTIELTKSNFSLKTCALDVIELLSHLANDKDIKITKRMANVVIYADETKISQVIYNFISNAIKHSKDKSRVRVRIIDSEDSVRFEVIDNGTGIKSETIPYIWDRYYKIDKGFNRNSDSTGLGLAISKAILEAHNAKYGVISKEGEGSTFYFELSKDYDDEK